MSASSGVAIGSAARLSVVIGATEFDGRKIPTHVLFVRFVYQSTICNQFANGAHSPVVLRLSLCVVRASRLCINVAALLQQLAHSHRCVG